MKTKPCTKIGCPGTMILEAPAGFPPLWYDELCGTAEAPEPPEQPDTVEEMTEIGDIAREHPVALGPGAPYLTDHLGRAIPGADL